MAADPLFKLRELAEWSRSFADRSSYPRRVENLRALARLCEAVAEKEVLDRAALLRALEEPSP